jgi:hypothetical protein
MNPKHAQLLETYPLLIGQICDRASEVNQFRQFLEKQTNWLSAPASSRYHLNIPQGLLIHSAGVAMNALRIKKLLAPDIDDESVIIVSLFHDVGKVGYPGEPYYLANTDTKDQAKGIRYKINPAIPYMSHAVRSLQLLSQYVPLSAYEAQAIVAHDGIYPTNGGVNNLEYHHRECRLQMILHFADKWTAAVEEEIENRKLLK